MDEVVVGVLGVPLINTAASSNVKSVVARMPLATASAASSIVWYISKRVGWVSQAIIIIIIITSSSSSSSHHHHHHIIITSSSQHPPLPQPTR